MMGNDLSNAPTRRYWVISDAVLMVDTTVDEKKSRWWKRGQTKEVHERTVPDLAALSKLWRWSSLQGVRLDLVFVGDTSAAPTLWEMLDRGSANPFADWVPYENFSGVTRDMAYRPDVLGVIDIPERSAIYGGRGLTMNEVP